LTIYLDTSAAAKLLVEEAESAALARYLDDLDPGNDLVSSALLETELRRVAVRLQMSQSAVSAVLARVALVDLQRSLVREAGVLPGNNLRSQDALHLATALRMDDAVVVAYDIRLLAAARSLGLEVASPM
jgi:predicted nucleic acid-binding protein